MANLSNINDLFEVESTGAIKFSNQSGTSGQVLKSNGNAAPTWVNASTVIGGPYLPLTGGTLTGNLAINGSNSLTVGGALSGSTATFSGNVGIGVAAHGTASLNITNANQHIRLNNGSELGVISLLSTGELDIWGHGTNETINFRTGTGSGTVALDITGVNSTFAGNVGIGRSPVAYGSFKVLNLAGSSGAIQKLIHTGNTVELQSFASASVGAIGTATNHSLLLTTGDVTALTIDTHQQISLNGVGGSDGFTVPFYNDPGYSNMTAGGFGILFRNNYDSYVTNNAYYVADPGGQWRSKYTTRAASVLSMLDGKFGFSTAAANTTSPYGLAFSEVMTILQNGNVGIGTTNPILYSSGWGKALGIKAASGYAVIQVAGSNGNGGEVDLGDASIRHAAIASLTGSKLAFYTNGSNSGSTVLQRMTIDGSGKVGIGTASPVAKFHVSGDTGGTDSIARFQNTNSAKVTKIQLLDSSGTVGDALIAYDHSNASSGLHYLGMGVNNITTLVINNNDNVGIGTTSPNKKLTVYGGNDNGIWIDSQGAQYTSLAFGNNGTEKANIAWDNTNGYTNISTYSNGHLAMSTGGSINAFLNSSGNFGIGLTIPSAKLHVQGKVKINSATAPAGNAELNIGYVGGGETRSIDIHGGWTGNESKSITFTHGTSLADIVGQINVQHTSPGSRIRWGKLFHSGNSSTYTMTLTSTSTTTADLTVAGNITASADVVAYSDKRLKSNIKTLDGSKVLKMRGVSFDKEGQKGSGVIAQELEKIAPELVNNDNEYKGVAYGNLTGYLIEAIKELEARVKELENK